MKSPSIRSSKRKVRVKQPIGSSEFYDVIVVGGGPAGSVMAWSLSKQGINVLLLERARFPREKVCGDFIEPRGLRILDKLGCLASLEKTAPLPITSVAMFVGSQCSYRGSIPFYGLRNDLPPHGYIIPRDVLDDQVLKCAAKAGAIIREETTVKTVDTTERGVNITAQHGTKNITYRAQLVVGADGVNSVVAKNAGLRQSDPRYIAVSQRAYAGELSNVSGEAAFFFDRDFFPGYAWLFPMASGKANIGVGILSETRDRYQINVPELFREFVEKLRRTHPRCADLHVTSRPIGGIVKTYGGIGKNYFNRGILIGDAGCFVDPMTGEGITSAMESALIGSSILTAAIEKGQYDAAFLSSYQQRFREYFDPAMCYVDLCASLMRNRHFSDSWLNAVARGCELAVQDPSFAKTTGATFGGMEIDPFHISTQIWAKTTGELATLGTHSLFGLVTGNTNTMFGACSDLVALQANWWSSIVSDPVWHMSWASDISQKWLKLMTCMSAGTKDPRASGILQ